MLYTRRVEAAERDAAEAEGRSFWTKVFAVEQRRRLIYVFERLVNRQQALADLAYKEAAQQILEQFGAEKLSDDYSLEEQFRAFFLGCSDHFFPNTVEALHSATTMLSTRYSGFGVAVSGFESEVNRIFLEDRISWELLQGQMIPKESQELHVSVVVPVLTLLSGRSGFASVERAYQDALEELATGDPSDAITDAGTALQETLTALGFAGNALGPLIKDARAKGLFANHDAGLLKPILDWVSADRSEKGDGHSASAASPPDAWLTVHVVGALILRLLDATPRQAT